MVSNKTLFFLIAAIILVFDQLTKWIVRTAFELGESLTLIPGILNLSRVHNSGAAFGIGQEFTALLILATIIIIVIILYTYADFIKETKLTILGGLIIGGAFGNLVDRIAYGFVIDFIDFSVWPAFNIADSAITIGGVGLFLVYIFTKKLK